MTLAEIMNPKLRMSAKTHKVLYVIDLFSIIVVSLKLL